MRNCRADEKKTGRSRPAGQRISVKNQPLRRGEQPDQHCGNGNIREIKDKGRAFAVRFDGQRGFRDVGAHQRERMSLERPTMEISAQVVWM